MFTKPHLDFPILSDHAMLMLHVRGKQALTTVYFHSSLTSLFSLRVIPMRVMVYEPLGTGHRFAYMAHLLPEMAKLNVTPVLVTTEQALQSAPFQLHLGDYTDDFEVDATLSLARKPSSFQVTDGFEQSLKRVKPDHCLLPVGDAISQIIGVRRVMGQRSPAQNVETEVLHFRGRFGYPIASVSARVKRFAARLAIAKAPWQRLFHLDAYQLAALCRNNEGLAKRSAVMPDPVETPPPLDKSAARDVLNLPQEGRIVGCAGGINQRKGADLLLQSFATALPRLRANDRLLLAGPISDPVRALIQHDYKDLRDAQRIICLDQYLSVEDMATSMIAMDLICTPYPEHSGSSSIVIRAAAVNRPLVAADVNWMGRTVRQFQLGQTIDVNDKDVFAESIVTGLDAAQDFRLGESGEQFVRFHSGENFAATWLTRIREKLSLPIDPRQIAWDA